MSRDALKRPTLRQCQYMSNQEDGRHDLLCTVFILYAEQCPDPTTNDFGKGDEEGHQRGMLRVMCINSVEYPVEAYDGVDEHGSIIPPCVFESERRSKEPMLCIRIDQTCASLVTQSIRQINPQTHSSP